MLRLARSFALFAFFVPLTRAGNQMPNDQQNTVPPAAAFDSEAMTRLTRSYRQVKISLLAERVAGGHWEGELSTSALATATAVMALEMVRRGGGNLQPESRTSRIEDLIEGGVLWISEHQNADGGWGDTTRSFSNISTTMLCHAVFYATSTAERFASVVGAAKTFIDRAGGVSALRARYGNDKTFSIPILTHCALAGLVDWNEIAPLPFELACIPANFYKWVRLPVVSYALPALIAIGQVRHHFAKPRNLLLRRVRDWARARSLAILQKIQPPGGGFLEAAPLTSFVTMSLAGMGLVDHPVARSGVAFLVNSVRPDGSWPIDSNLATWVTTLSINALAADLPADAAGPLQAWLLDQQYHVEHPYTNAAPGGWAWTDLPGGVPDADDTPGAILAVLILERHFGSNAQASAARCPPSDRSAGSEPPAQALRQRTSSAIIKGAGWLLNLQNGDGGWPTFCRGWGTLPFDRSAPDLTAHAIRALVAVGRQIVDLKDRDKEGGGQRHSFGRRLQRAVDRGFQYLEQTQRADGSWLPLWFGNQHVERDENPVYGTARVLAAYRDAGRLAETAGRRGVEWLRMAQNADGGWGGAAGIVSSIEETALTVEVLLSLEFHGGVPPQVTTNGLFWLVGQIDNGKLMEPSPIGFYFAKLWYFEKLYPLIFTAAALRRAVEVRGGISPDETTTGNC